MSSGLASQACPTFCDLAPMRPSWPFGTAGYPIGDAERLGHAAEQLLLNLSPCAVDAADLLPRGSSSYSSSSTSSTRVSTSSTQQDHGNMTAPARSGRSPRPGWAGSAPVARPRWFTAHGEGHAQCVVEQFRSLADEEANPRGETELVDAVVAARSRRPRHRYRYGPPFGGKLFHRSWRGP